MPYDAATGVFTPYDESVTNRVNDLTKQDSPLMQQARTMGLQQSNRRGLLNSSMAVQASQNAALSAATPIASQEAQQAASANQLDKQLYAQEKNNNAQLAAQEKTNAAQLASTFENSYSQVLSGIMQNTSLPADVRQQYLSHTSAIRDSNLKLVEQMYGIKLDWATPSGTGGGGTQQATLQQSAQAAQTAANTPFDINFNGVRTTVYPDGRGGYYRKTYETVGGGRSGTTTRTVKTPIDVAGYHRYS